MKILEIPVMFSKEEWDLLRLEMSETEIKIMLNKAMDTAIAERCQKVEAFPPEEQEESA